MQKTHDAQHEDAGELFDLLQKPQHIPSLPHREFLGLMPGIVRRASPAGRLKSLRTAPEKKGPSMLIRLFSIFLRRSGRLSSGGRRRFFCGRDTASRPWRIVRLKRFASQTIRPVASRKNPVLPLCSGRAALCRRPGMSFSTARALGLLVHARLSERLAHLLQQRGRHGILKLVGHLLVASIQRLRSPADRSWMVIPTPIGTFRGRPSRSGG